MTDLEQRKIFAKNLNYFITLNNLNQKEVADAIGVIPQTFNTWCQGQALPRMGKVQKLADYFGIGKSDLLDEKLDSDPLFDARVLTDMNTLNMVREYYELSLEDRNMIKNLISSLNRKTER